MLNLGLEAELIREILDRIAVVVDHDLVEDVVVELEEVRAAVGSLERNEVRDERDHVRILRAHERVHVRVVSQRILLISGASRWLDARVGIIEPPISSAINKTKNCFFTGTS